MASSDDIKKWRGNWAAHEATMDEEEKKIGAILAQAMPVVFAKWRPDPKTEKKKKAMLAVAAGVNASLEGGIAQFAKTVKKSMTQWAKEGYNPYKGAHGSKPDGTIIDEKDQAKLIELQQAGLAAVGNTAFVLCAGGSGSRLHVKGAKLCKLADTSRHITFLEHYLTHILAFQRAARRAVSGREANNLVCPVVIMVSTDDMEEVKALLAEKDTFGFPEDQVTLIAQSKVFQFKDADHIPITHQKDPFHFELKSHGSGDIHHLLRQDPELLAGWTKKGIKYITFFGDNNLLALNSVLAALGTSEEQSLELNYVSTPRGMPDAKHGDVVTQPLVSFHKKKTDATWMSCIPNSLLSHVFHESKLKDSGANGLSDYPHATGTFIATLDRYLAVFGAEEPVKLMEWVAPEWKDRKKQSFKNGGDTIQCNAESLGEVYPNDAKVSHTCMPNWMCWAPVLHSWDEGKALDKNKMGYHTLATAEAALYYYNRRLLADCGGKVDVELDKVFNAGGLQMKGGARVIMEPSFAISIAELLTKFERPRVTDVPEADSKIGVVVTPKSVLILSGQNLRVAGLQVDGSLYVKASNKSHVLIDNLILVNEGWHMSSINEKKRKRMRSELWDYMQRGFKVSLSKDMVCTYDLEGSFELFRQTQRGRPIGGWPEPVEELRPATGARTQSQLSTRGSKNSSRSPTPRGETPKN